MFYLPAALAVLPWLSPMVAAHSCLWHPSMWGFNVTAQTYSYDNRPVVPLMHTDYDKWWFHGHLDYPPPDGVFMELPAGGTFHSEIACDKGATTMFASSPGGDIQNGNNPCPGSPTAAFHANSKDDARGCALAIAYKSDVNDVKPEDFTIFSTNKTCVWYRFTDFQIPTDLPPCPEGGCICSFNWIHAPDSGSEQIFFNGYRCKVTNSNSNKKVAKPRVARRCGPNPDGVDFTPSPWNCTYGAKQAMYWIQNEGNTFFEGNHDPPYYNDFYNFPEGAQNDIFEDSQIPIFNDKGEHTGYTTLGGSTASIVFPTVSSWPTDRPDIPWGAVSFPSSSGSGSSGSGNSDSGNSTPPASSSPAPAPSSSPSPHGSIATNIAVDPISADPSPTSSAVPTASAGSNSSDTSSTSTTTNTNSKCRKRSGSKKRAAKKRAILAHEKMHKRHDAFGF